MKKQNPPNIAFFVSHHGFGHAARACSVMAALREQAPDIGFEIFSTLPRWFFENSLGNRFVYHHQVTDVGLRQVSPFLSDLQATLDELRLFLPFAETRVQNLAQIVRESACRLIVCDIAPLGIAVAETAGLESLLIENFTWDWIYNGFSAEAPEIKRYADYLANTFRRATRHIQTEPVCEYRRADLLAAPAGRTFRTLRKTTRNRLEIPEEAPVVLLTFGGVQNRDGAVANLGHIHDVHFILPGVFDRIQRQDNLILIPHDSGFFHPDLIQASDVVVGKAGYSTIAEVYYAGVPFGFVSRSDFRESPILERFIREHMSGRSIPEQDLVSGRWTEQIPELMSLPAKTPNHPNGADQIAAFVLSLL